MTVVRDRHRGAIGDDGAADAVAQGQPHLHERIGRGADGDPHVEGLPGVVDEPHPREVGAQQFARPGDDHLERLLDVGLCGLDLHPDLHERLVRRGPPCLHLGLLDQQREVLGEDRHQRPRVARAHATATQVGDQRAPDPARGITDGLDPMLDRRARPRGQPGRGERSRPRLADAVRGDHLHLVAHPPRHGAVLRLHDGSRGLQRRAREFGLLHQLHRLNSYSCTSHSATRCLRTERKPVERRDDMAAAAHAAPGSSERSARAHVPTRWTSTSEAR